MISEYIIHQHRAGRSHFDLRIIQNRGLRSWSLLKEPPIRKGERRLAIERETFPAESIRDASFEEQAFGRGRVSAWDEGTVEVTEKSPRHLALVFHGIKLSGSYELRKMVWYPGNRWMLIKLHERNAQKAC